MKLIDQCQNGMSIMMMCDAHVYDKVEILLIWWMMFMRWIWYFQIFLLFMTTYEDEDSLFDGLLKIGDLELTINRQLEVVTPANVGFVVKLFYGLE